MAVGGGRVVGHVGLDVGADFPGDGQPDLFALVVGHGGSALVDVLGLLDELGHLRAHLDFLLPTNGLGSRDQFLPALLFRFSASDLHKKTLLNHPN